MMRSINIPNESFQNGNEVKIINNLLYDNIDTLNNYIDESIEIWIIGNRDEEFLDSLTRTAFSQNRIYDPFDELPVSQHRKLQHVAVITNNNQNLKEISKETIYGNVDYNIYDFVRSLIFRLVTKFPKKTDCEGNSKTGRQLSHINRSHKVQGRGGCPAV